ncbi:29429_t:CDS:2, partial [Gigaspora margarita]
ELFPFSKNEWNFFEGDILKYWKYCAEIRPELSSVALRLHGILTNSASVERLFSSMGFFHTKTRNRLSLYKVLNMSKLRASMLYKDRIEKIKDSANFVDFNIAPPIFQNFELEDDDDELNENFISNTVEWSRVLDTWFSMIDDEENASQLYYEDDELDTTNSTTSQNLLNTTHLADNHNNEELMDEY